MNEKLFLKSYFDTYQKLISQDKKIINNLITLKKLIVDNSKRGKKILVFGNGGSAAIASHFTVDLTNEVNFIVP